MVSQVPLFLVIAESLLAFQASSYPELAGPDDADTEISAGDVDKIGSSASLAFFDDLLSYERAVEDDLAYRRQTVGVPFGYDLILESDEYMNVVCREAALIADRKSGHVGIVLGRPFVDSLVAAGTQRSLADQVRVFTYLVRISCKLVGSRGGVTGFGGDAVCFFRMIVGILAASFALCVWKYATKPTTTETRSASAERMLSASIPAMIWPQFTILPSSVICDGWFFVRFPACASGGRNLFPTVRPMEVLQMIAYVVRCDVCAAEAFVPLNQDPDMAMSARGWRMRPHSKVCPDCVFALEGPKIPPSMAEVR